MDNLDRAIAALTRTSLIFAVDARIGKVCALTLTEYMRLYEQDLIPHTDPNVAIAHAQRIRAQRKS